MKLPIFPWPLPWPGAWHRHRPKVRRRPADLPELIDDAAEAPPPGCGWFDSSHELQRGLLVTEHATADGVAGELPLHGWIDLHLAGWQAPAARLQ